MTGQTGVSSFYVKATSESTVNAAISSVRHFPLQATRDEDAYDVSNQSDVLDTMDDVTNTMSLLLAGNCRYFPSCWRDRYYEYHAGIRDGTHP